VDFSIQGSSYFLKAASIIANLARIYKDKF